MSLFQRLFGRSRAQPPPPVEDARLADGERVYAFGDLHGRLDLLTALKAAIARDMAAGPAASATVVGLGDYIDRGPDSRGVIDALIAGFPGCTTVCLRGNHEQMLLDFLEDPGRYGPPWFRNGADETLRSYGVPSWTLVGVPKPDAVRDQLARVLPPAHVMFLQRLPLSFEAGSYFFVHAGARPGIPLRDQSPRDLLWTRLKSEDDDPAYEKVVVHGHTPVEKPYVARYRINLDTGAFFTNQLSCLVLEGTRRRFLNLA